MNTRKYPRSTMEAFPQDQAQWMEGPTAKPLSFAWPCLLIVVCFVVSLFI